jgi:O-antigen/teichoic acid export membrane protein
MRRTVRAVSTFLFIDGLSTFQARVQVVILSLLTTEAVVGLYGAVVQITQPFHLIATSLVLANFPALSKSAEAKTDQQRRLTHWLIELLLLMALPLLVGVWFTGSDLLLFIYRNRGFAEAAPALVVVVVGLIGVSFIRPLGYLLVANRLERINMREVIITTIIGTLLSIVLIARFQLMGAALASALIAFISAAQYVYALYTRLFPLNIWRIISVPLLVSGLMLAVILISQQITTETLSLLVISTAFYTLFIGVVGVHALGGPKTVYAALRRSRP